jgi:hypothetical protein
MTNQDEPVIPRETDNGEELEDSWECPYCGQRNDVRTTCLRCGYDREKRTHARTHRDKFEVKSLILGGFFGAILGGVVTFALLALIEEIANWSGWNITHICLC